LVSIGDIHSAKVTFKKLMSKQNNNIKYEFLIQVFRRPFLLT